LLSLNKLTKKLVDRILDDPQYYNVLVEKLPCGSTVIDTGLEAKGGYETGLMTTRVAMGGAGDVSLSYSDYSGLQLPTIVVSTDHPAWSLFGAQLAGWKISVEDYTADGSGPARALALKPKKVFQKIEYKDESEYATILLESHEKPTDIAARFIAETCNVKPDNLFMLLTSTTSMAGMVQISGRIVETGLFRLDVLGVDLKKVRYGVGYAPIMPLHVDNGKAMGRAEDALTYGGVTSFVVEEEEQVLADLANKTPSSNCKDYGRTSYEIYSEVNFDFTKIDPALFAPAAVTLVCAKTGRVFSNGKINNDILKQSIVD
jgi:methenyltetrahydromethanopterin cyclohydrolase